MSSLLEIKEYVKNFYAKNEAYLKPACKFILAFVLFLAINAKMGYMEKLDSIVIVLVAALFCSFMPLFIMAVISAAMLLLHYYALSPECAAVAAVLLLVMLLFYVRFVPKEILIVLITPLFFLIKIPYLIPIAVGLLCGPASIISVAFGVIISYLIEYTEINATTISSMDAETSVAKLRFVIDGLLGNRAMLVTIIAFAVTILLVYTIRRRSMDHAWTIAIVTGALSNIMILMVGDLFLDLNYSIVGILIGTLIAGVLCRFLEFFSFNLDYNRTETVQFEDDEYYYYVKAVPKITVAAPEKKVKKINTARVESARKSSSTSSQIKTANGVTRQTSSQSSDYGRMPK